MKFWRTVRLLYIGLCFTWLLKYESDFSMTAKKGLVYGYTLIGGRNTAGAPAARISCDSAPYWCDTTRADSAVLSAPPTMCSGTESSQPRNRSLHPRSSAASRNATMEGVAHCRQSRRRSGTECRSATARWQAAPGHRRFSAVACRRRELPTH